MKNDISQFLVDSFVDYKGEKHMIILCGLTMSPDDSDFDLVVGWENKDEGWLDVDSDIYHPVCRMLCIGYSICNPEDKFDENLGKKIALNRANVSVPKLVTLENGVINQEMVTSFLNKEMKYIKSNPGKFIKGYSENEAKFLETESDQKEINSLTKDEKNILDYILSGFKMDKYINLAKKIINNPSLKY